MKKTKKQSKNKTAREITKNMSFLEIMEKFPETTETLLESGMHCIGCPMAMQETLEQGAIAHGIDANKLVKELNKKLKK